MGVASLVLGIISILLSLVPIVGFVFAVIALIVAIIGSAIIPLILIIEALKVIRLTEDSEQPSDNITIPAIIAIAIVLSAYIGIGIYKVSVVNDIWEGLKDQITNNNGNNNNQDNDNNQGELPSVDKEDEKEPEQQQSEDDKGKFDPYANYKDLVWNTSTKIDSTVGLKYEIKNGKLYYSQDSSAQKLVAGITGTPLKLKSTAIGGEFAMYIVTSNKIYITGDGYGGEVTLVADLSKYDIIDMTIIYENHGQEYNYYLTSTGSLIDKNGVTYDKNRFTDSYGLNKITKISIDKNQYGYYYDEKTYIAVQDKSTGAKIQMSQIYNVNSGNVALIVSKENKIYEYGQDGENATYVGVVDKMYRDFTNNDEYIMLIVRLKDGAEKLYEYCENKAYDVVNKKDIDLTKLELGPVTMDSIIVNTINDILHLKFVDLKYEYPTKSYFAVNEKITVNGVKYSGLINYYKTVVPEVNETSSQYAIPEGYKFALKDNGSAIVIRKVD